MANAGRAPTAATATPPRAKPTRANWSPSDDWTPAAQSQRNSRSANTERKPAGSAAEVTMRCREYGSGLVRRGADSHDVGRVAVLVADQPDSHVRGYRTAVGPDELGAGSVLIRSVVR